MFHRGNVIQVRWQRDHIMVFPHKLTSCFHKICIMPFCVVSEALDTSVVSYLIVHTQGLHFCGYQIMHFTFKEA